MNTQPMTPSEWAAQSSDGYYDCTCYIGPFESNAQWRMYSFERPAYLLWNAIASELHANGWTDNDIKNWLQSKEPRWSLDSDLGEALEDLGRQFAQKILK